MFKVKPVGDNWSYPLDSSPSRSDLSQCTSLTCVHLILSSSITSETILEMFAFKILSMHKFDLHVMWFTAKVAWCDATVPSKAKYYWRCFSSPEAKASLGTWRPGNFFAYLEIANFVKSQRSGFSDNSPALIFSDCSTSTKHRVPRILPEQIWLGKFLCFACSEVSFANLYLVVCVLAKP